MERKNQKLEITIEEFTYFLKEKFHIFDFSIIELKSDKKSIDMSKQEGNFLLFKNDEKIVYLATEKNISRKDLLTIEVLVNLFQIHIESENLISDSFSDLTLKRRNLYNNFTDNFPGILAIMDLEGKNKFINNFTSNNFKEKYWQKEQDILEKNKHIEKLGYLKEFDFIFDKKGELRNFENHSFLVEENGEKSILLLGIDITEKNVLENRLNDLAYKDSLTGINNYNFLLMKIEELINKKEDFSLVYIDIKKFGIINEIYGYEVGDKILIHVVKLINYLVLKLEQNKNTILTRFKDDEFIVIYKNNNKIEVLDFARELIEFLKQPIVINDIAYRLDLDVGISTFPEDGIAKETLIRKAGLAKNKAKRNSEFNIVSFSGSLETEIKKEYELEIEIYDSLEKGEFELFLQPILDLNTEKIVKAEALIRWNHKKYGIIGPKDFIPVAEKSNLILKIGEWVIEESCKILKKWGYKNINIPISINISGKQLLQYNFLKIVEDIFARYEVEPEKIIMEVTENYLLENVEHLERIIIALNKLGIQFSMDDFGTGNSSITKLKHINFAEIKIDRSFIAGLFDNKTDGYLVKNIIALAGDLELDVVAEGIEDLKQYGFLTKLGCKYGQGYLFSRPVSVKDFEKLLDHKFQLKKKALEEFNKNVTDHYFCNYEEIYGESYYNLPIPVIILDHTFVVKCINKKFQEIFKWDRKELIGRNLREISEANTIEYLKEVINKKDRSIEDVTLPLMKKNGSFIDTVIKIEQGLIPDDPHEDIIGVIIQVNKKKKSCDMSYREFLENLPNSILVTDLKGNIEYINKKFSETTGYSSEEVYGQTPRILSSGLIPKEVFKNLWSTILQGKEWQGELHNKRKNKEFYWQSVKINPIFNKKRKIEKFIASIEDITEKKAYEKRLRYLAKIDPMTGALTRAAGIEFIELFFAEGLVKKEELVLIFLDLDNLKEINDQFGHSKGDEAIKIVAEVIQKNIRKDNLFIRYGGDEFLIVLRNNEEHPHDFIINRISVDLQIRSRSFDSPISLSCGISNLGEVEEDSLEKMIKRADERMYFEKKRKKQV